MRCGPILTLLAAAALMALATSCGARTALRVAGSTDARTDGGAEAAAGIDANADAADVTQPDCRRAPALCDDGNACTTDRCGDDGACRHLAVRCVDGDPCTADVCDPARGCTFPRTECGGCADGERDAFRDRVRYADIAGCAGGFQNPGLAHEASPTCGRAAGNNGPNPTGVGCNASDLCAPGWHICRAAGEVAGHSVDGCAGAHDASAGSFFATRQTGPGCLECATGAAADCTPTSCRSDCSPASGATNDLFGCGNVGSSPRASCAPLDRSSNNLCSALPPPWRCDQGVDADTHESERVVKPGPAAGGVLCCRD